MRSVHADVHRRSGIAATYELLKDGHTPRRLALAVRVGEVIRVRQGHYACPELDELQKQAYRVGGRLTGIQGASAHGIWIPRSARVDIQVRPDARALRSRADPRKRLAETPDADVQVAWTDHGRPGTRSLAAPIDCLGVLISHSSPRESFAAVESALHKSVISRAEWRTMRAQLPASLARSLERAGHRSESGGESLLLFDLLGAGIEVRQQVRIAGVGRVDMIIGERLIVEVDGYEFHSTRADFEEDRRRDAASSALGYRTLRFSHAQVERGDPVVLASIRAAVARGDHL
ncbi:MAG: endonuclease domain-containing protein [Actinobacteria bacterium]|nr:endonuclease domain-containing protein [Actinomycetota bacterium]